MAQDTTLLDLDSLLDGSLDAVADVPDYVTPPAGVYLLSIASAELVQDKDKEGKARNRLVIAYKVDATVEVEGTDLPVADGSLFSERFTYSEEGLGYFKRMAKNWLNADVTGVSLRDILSTLADSPSTKAVITLAKSGEYTNVRVRPVHEEV